MCKMALNHQKGLFFAKSVALGECIKKVSNFALAYLNGGMICTANLRFPKDASIADKWAWGIGS